MFMVPTRRSDSTSTLTTVEESAAMDLVGVRTTAAGAGSLFPLNIRTSDSDSDCSDGGGEHVSSCSSVIAPMILLGSKGKEASDAALMTTV